MPLAKSIVLIKSPKKAKDIHLFEGKAFKKKQLILTAVMLVTLAPAYFSISGQIRDGRDVSSAFERTSLIQGLSGVATAFEYIDLVNRINDGGLAFENGKQYYYNIIAFIPRFIWPNKPIVSFSVRMSGILYGPIGPSAWVHTYTIWGEGYSQFGWVGTFLSSVQLIGLILLLSILVKKFPRYQIIYFKYMLVGFPILLRGDLSTFYGAFYKIIISIIVIILFTQVLKLVYKK